MTEWRSVVALIVVILSAFCGLVVFASNPRLGNWERWGQAHDDAFRVGFILRAVLPFALIWLGMLGSALVYEGTARWRAFWYGFVATGLVLIAGSIPFDWVQMVQWIVCLILTSPLILIARVVTGRPLVDLAADWVFYTGAISYVLTSCLGGYLATRFPPGKRSVTDWGD